MKTMRQDLQFILPFKSNQSLACYLEFLLTAPVDYMLKYVIYCWLFLLQRAAKGTLLL